MVKETTLGPSFEVMQCAPFLWNQLGLNWLLCKIHLCVTPFDLIFSCYWVSGSNTQDIVTRLGRICYIFRHTVINRGGIFIQYTLTPDIGSQLWRTIYKNVLALAGSRVIFLEVCQDERGFARSVSCFIKWSWQLGYPDGWLDFKQVFVKRIQSDM